ncbi:hypothetical protein RUM43_009330 [Polyplax serrata]|uniref:Uncharacterized protein n=1 Tax=Polyplax serrata TaxID=468196 RepID=A0AAN8S230_POLSC
MPPPQNQEHRDPSEDGFTDDDEATPLTQDLYGGRIKQIDQTILLNNGILPTWYLDCYFKAESTLCQAEEESINASRRRNCVLAGLMREHQHKDSLNELPLYVRYIIT